MDRDNEYNEYEEDLDIEQRFDGGDGDWDDFDGADDWDYFDGEDDWDETGADDEFGFDGEIDDDEFDMFSEFDDDYDEFDDFFGKRRKKKRRGGLKKLVGKVKKETKRRIEKVKDINKDIKAEHKKRVNKVKSRVEDADGRIRKKRSQHADMFEKAHKKRRGSVNKVISRRKRKIRGLRKRMGIGEALSQRLRNMKVVKFLFKRGKIGKHDAEKLMDRIDARYGDIGDTSNFSGEETFEFFGKKAKRRRALRKSLKDQGYSKKEARTLARKGEEPSKIGAALKNTFKAAKTALQNSGQIDGTAMSTMDAAPSLNNPLPPESKGIPAWVWIGGGVAVLGTVAFLIFRKK